VQQDLLCRVLGRCRHGAPLDRELGALQEPGGPLPAERLFTYLRYDVDLAPAGLRALGLHGLDARRLQRLDAVEQLDALRQVGLAGARQVRREHLAGFLSPDAGCGGGPPGREQTGAQGVRPAFAG
jgi:hypothetical protein